MFKERMAKKLILNIIAASIALILVLSIGISINSPKIKIKNNLLTGLFVGELKFSIGDGESQENGGESSSGGSGGSGGGGSSQNQEAESFIKINPEIIIEYLFQDESKRIYFFISNLNGRTSALNIKLEEINNLAKLPEENVILGEKETKTVALDLYALASQKPGAYAGKIIVSDELGRKEIITVIIEVKERNSLFDIRLNILEPYKKVFAGSPLVILFNLENVGLRGTLVDVPITLSVLDLNNNIIFTSIKETVAVSSSYSDVKTVDVPVDLAAGKYLLRGTVTYGDDTTVEAYDTFEIISEKNINRSTVLELILAFTILIASLLTYIAFNIRSTSPNKKI